LQFGVLELVQLAERTGKVARPDDHGVHPGHPGDGFGLAHAGDAFDLHRDQQLGVAVGQGAEHRGAGPQARSARAARRVAAAASSTPGNTTQSAAASRMRCRWPRSPEGTLTMLAVSVPFMARIWSMASPRLPMPCSWSMNR